MYSGHADREGLLNWISAYKKKPGFVFVNHGDSESCEGFAETVRETFGIQAAAPYSGAEFDLISGEWIRITDPVYKKRENAGKAAGQSARAKKDSAFRELRDAVEALDRYTAKMEGVSNQELRILAEKIRELISGQD